MIDSRPEAAFPLLEVRDLRTLFALEEGVVRAVDGCRSRSSAAGSSDWSASPAAARR